MGERYQQLRTRKIRYGRSRDSREPIQMIRDSQDPPVDDLQLARHSGNDSKFLGHNVPKSQNPVANELVWRDLTRTIYRIKYIGSDLCARSDADDLLPSTLILRYPGFCQIFPTLADKTLEILKLFSLSKIKNFTIF